MRFTPRLATAGDHMLDPQDLISHMKEYTSFLADLSHVRAEVLLSPMAVNKWSAQEAIAHIMAWDANFLRTAVLPIEAGKHPHVADEADFQAFNEWAAALGRRLTKKQLLDKATHTRMQLVEHLNRLPSEAFQIKQQGGRIDSDLAEFLERNFVSHDKHHIEQIRAYLAVQGV
jgi:hypothetical protein